MKTNSGNATTTLPNDTPSPILRVSPKHTNSNLYDSYELQAVAKQLSRALQANGASPLSPYSFYLKSHLHRQRVRKIYGQNGRPRKIASSTARIKNQKESDDRNVKANETEATIRRGCVMKLWKKVRRMLSWNNYVCNDSNQSVV